MKDLEDQLYKWRLIRDLQQEIYLQKDMDLKRNMREELKYSIKEYEILFGVLYDSSKRPE